MHMSEGSTETQRTSTEVPPMSKASVSAEIESDSVTSPGAIWAWLWARCHNQHHVSGPIVRADQAPNDLPAISFIREAVARDHADLLTALVDLIRETDGGAQPCGHQFHQAALDAIRKASK